jgi:DNA-3-methyladenine glycosylase I
MAGDARVRCWWPDGIQGADPLMVAYHDDEWGRTVDDDRALFERLALESFQAGLSWATILRKRAAFQRAFADFDPATVAAFGDPDRQRLLADAAIVRNRAKIGATIDNAAALMALAKEYGSFAAYLAGRLPRPAPIRASGSNWSHLPSTTAESDALSADLRRLGFRFVGPTIVYSFMQSVGLVDDHLPGCFRYRGSLPGGGAPGGARPGAD